VPDGKRDPSSRPDTGLAHSEVSLTRGRSVFLTRSLQRRLLFFGGILTFFPLAIIFLVVLNANERIGSAAQEESRKLAFADLDHIAQGVVQLMDGLYEQGGESETPSAEQLAQLLRRRTSRSFKVGQDRLRLRAWTVQGQLRELLPVASAMARTSSPPRMPVGTQLHPGPCFAKARETRSPPKSPRTSTPGRTRATAAGPDQGRPHPPPSQPWDLVVGAGSYLDEFEAAERRVARASPRRSSSLAARAP
jgi:hypothetical protein